MTIKQPRVAYHLANLELVVAVQFLLTAGNGVQCVFVPLALEQPTHVVIHVTRLRNDNVCT
jgi:hypothetical protein